MNTLKENEKKLIIERLEEYQYNMKQTADSLGISHSSLYYKCRIYKINTRNEKKLIVPEIELNVLEQQERKIIIETLERCKFVQKDAAKLLGVSSRALNYKIGKKYELRHYSWNKNV